ncbi:MAG: hypothetical protein LC798_18260, partial [Chloroflexi bacterium]|nr:hypothetical protein [Chloroflexota bacterium]
MTAPSGHDRVVALLREQLHGPIEHVGEAVEVGGVVRRMRTDEARPLPKPLREPMKRADGDAIQAADGAGEMLGQWPVEAGQQHFEALGGEAARLLGDDECLPGARHAEDHRSTLRVERVEDRELALRERDDACLVGCHPGRQRRLDHEVARQQFVERPETDGARRATIGRGITGGAPPVEGLGHARVDPRQVVGIDHHLARSVRGHGSVVGAIGEADRPREARSTGGPGRHCLAHATKRVHLAHRLRDRVLDLVAVAVAVERLPSAADPGDPAALD